ncbi:hypothetical protein [Rhizohabitans arisaemae]|uniref:hypothetical protein n=1 Tax=Rhizohabitans arisaemae TaxID=2720610 RepID=UPI0024B222D6|nr:hypothetical protein [Rhizohabitans arisaemae]
MPNDQRDLRDLRGLLEAGSRPALDRPISWAALCVKEGAVRRRRFSAFGAAVAVAGVTAVAVAASGTLAGSDKIHLSTSGVSLSGTSAAVDDGFPDQYTEEDGTVYRRVATATLDGPSETSTEVDVEVRGKPLAVLLDCPSSNAGPAVTVSAQVDGSTRFRVPRPLLYTGCETKRAVDVGWIPAEAQKVSLKIDALMLKGEADRDQLKQWRFGVYEWTPPATLKAAPKAVEPPAVRKYPGQASSTLIAKKSITWPDSREVTLTVPKPNQSILVDVNCQGSIAHRIKDELRVNGRLINLFSWCSYSRARLGGGFVLYKDQLGNKKTVTIKIRLVTDIPDYRKRSGTVTLAVYDYPRSSPPTAK